MWWLSGRLLDLILRVLQKTRLTGGTVLCPWARHFSLCFVLVQPREKCLDITEKLLIGMKRVNRNKQITLLLLIPNLSVFENTVNLNQMASDKAIWSVSTLFSILIENKKCVTMWHNFSRIEARGQGHSDPKTVWNTPRPQGVSTHQRGTCIQRLFWPPYEVLFCLFVLLLYVPSQQLWSLQDGQFT